MKSIDINQYGISLWKLSIYWKDPFEDYAKKHKQYRVENARLYLLEIAYEDLFILRICYNRIYFRKL